MGEPQNLAKTVNLGIPDELLQLYEDAFASIYHDLISRPTLDIFLLSRV